MDLDRTAARPPLGIAPVLHATAVPRSDAGVALQRAIGSLEAAGTPFVLECGPRRLAVSDVAWSPVVLHPAARRLAVLNGHVVDAEIRLLAAVQVVVHVVDGVLVLDGTCHNEAARPALAAGLQALGDEIESWAATVRGVHELPD